jgi:hypothetical protein
MCGFLGKVAISLTLGKLLFPVKKVYTISVVSKKHQPIIILQDAQTPTYKNHASIGPIAHQRSPARLKIPAIFPSSLWFFSIVLNRDHNEIPAISSPVVARNHRNMNKIPKFHPRNIQESENISSQIKINFFLLYLSAILPITNHKITTEKSKTPIPIPRSVHHCALAIIKGTMNRMIA